MTNVATNILENISLLCQGGGYDCVVATNGAWSRGERVSCAEHGFALEGFFRRGFTAAGFDDVFALPDHCDNGAGIHI